jgi:hypothetical protein
MWDASQQLVQRLLLLLEEEWNASHTSTIAAGADVPTLAPQRGAGSKFDNSGAANIGVDSNNGDGKISTDGNTRAVDKDPAGPEVWTLVEGAADGGGGGGGADGGGPESGRRSGVIGGDGDGCGGSTSAR